MREAGGGDGAGVNQRRAGRSRGARAGIERRARDAAETGGGGQTPPARLLLNDSGAGCGAGWETGSGSALAPSARAPPGRPGRTARASTSFATGSSGYSGHPCRAGRPRPSPPRSTSISTAASPHRHGHRVCQIWDLTPRPRPHDAPRAFPRARDPRGGRLAPRVPRALPASHDEPVPVRRRTRGAGMETPARGTLESNPGPARPVGR